MSSIVLLGLIAHLPHNRTMDFALHSCRPRLLGEFGVRSGQLLCSRDLARSFVPVRDREFDRICGDFAGGRYVYRNSYARILVYNSDWRWRRFANSQRGISGVIRAPERRNHGIVRFEKGNRNPDSETGERPPFDLDLAVVLAGFAFEAYNTPPENGGVKEKGAGDCETTFLAQHFLREIYDGQLFVKLKKAMHLPGLDLWGTSDPYVVLRCGDCEAQSKVVWATKDPVWNEEFKLNIKDPASQFLQVAAWDANVVTSHRRMGNTGLSLKDLSDGKKHDVELKLEGMGGGGAVQLKVQYKSFNDLDSDKSWWNLPSLTDLQIKGVEGVYNKVSKEDGIKAGDFVSSTLGSLQSVIKGKEDNNPEDKVQPSKGLASEARKNDIQDDNESAVGLEHDGGGEYVRAVVEAGGQTLASHGVDDDSSLPSLDRDTLQADEEVINKLGLEFQSKAEADLVESGLAMPSVQLTETSAKNESHDLQPKSEQLEKASKSMLQKTDNLLGLWATVARSFPGVQNGGNKDGPLDASSQALAETTGESVVNKHESVDKILEEECEDGQENEAKKQLFQTAESAVEAWAMLATTLGGRSFVKSEFEKVCFLENQKSDTQVAIWRDVNRRRLIVAFRGTEQTKWKDLSTDMNVIFVGFNPERIGGEMEEVMVHGGFMHAYDSVRQRLLTLVQASLGVRDNIDNDPTQSWHIYSTGHSLGGALATLFAYELSSSKLAKSGHIEVTMYNFGSPRVGNKRFADMYNQKIKDSWRVVNHRDIIPTVPRLMGYCHVAQPIYLSAGGLTDMIIESDLLDDGYQGDVIGEVTPGFVLKNVMRGERKMLQRILQTEVEMLRSIRDGSAVMQHMENFYFLALLERVEQKMAQKL